MRIFCPVFTAFFLGFGTVYVVRTGTVQSAIRDRQNQLVGLESKYVLNGIEMVKADTLFNAKQVALHGLFSETGAVQTAGVEAVSQEFLNFCVHRQIYDQLRFLDGSGMEVIRVNYNSGVPYIVAPEDLQSKRDRYYFEETIALDPLQVYISPFDLNVEHEEIERPLKPMIRFATPALGPDGQKRGIVVLNHFGQDLLDRLRALPQLPGAHSILLNADGYFLMGPETQDEWGFMFEDRKDRTFGAIYPDAWQRIQKIASGQFETDAGLMTFATVYPNRMGRFVPGSEEIPQPGDGAVPEDDRCWRIVSIVPYDIYYKEQNLWRVGLLTTLTFLALVLGFWSWRLALAREVRSQAEESRRILIAELRQALEDVKTLQGIVPICSHCRKVRDDAGYWSAVESYVSKNTGAVFSHGVCPSCMKEHYSVDVNSAIER